MTASIVFSSVISGTAAAQCLGSDDPVIARLEQATGRNSAIGAKLIGREIAVTSPAHTRRLAELHFAQSRALSMAGGDPSAALESALRAADGLAADDPVGMMVRLAGLSRMKSDSQKLKVLASIAGAYRSLPTGSMARTCRAVEIADRYFEAEKPREAFAFASQAYVNSRNHRSSLARAEAATLLAYLVSEGYDFAYARQLHSEALAILLDHGMTDLASDELLLRGYAQLYDGDWQRALDDFDASADMARGLGNEYAVQYAQLGHCSASLEGDAMEMAAPSCESAYAGLSRADGSIAFSATASLAQLRLAQGRPDEAIALLQPFLGGKRDEKPLEDWTGAFHTRAMAFASLNRHEQAYLDMLKARQEDEAYREAELQSGLNALRIRFQTEELQSSLATERRRSNARLHLVAVVVVAAITTLSLLGMIVFVLLGHRRKFRQLAMTDPLTGLANRRCTLKRAEEILRDGEARQQSTAFGLLDLDYFKSCNDMFGHDAGDRVLGSFANIIQRCVRPGDAVGRWGGEEFLLIAPGATGQDLARIVERIRREAEEEYFDYAHSFRLRFSAGIAELGETGGQADHCIKLADRRLYIAKEEGRNRTCMAGDELRKAHATEEPRPSIAGGAATAALPA